MHRYVATFHPQAWLRDNAIPVDAEGPTRFDVTPALRQSFTKDIRRAILDGTYRDDLDWLKDTAGAPAWLHEWSGPFEITIDIEQLEPEACIVGMPDAVADLCRAWDVFRVAVATARRAAASVVRIEDAAQLYLSAFEWKGARDDEGARTAKAIATRLANAASEHFAPAGQRLTIEANPLIAPFVIEEDRLRRDANPGEWSATWHAIEAHWLTFEPRVAWRQLTATYSHCAHHVASSQALGDLRAIFETRSTPLLTPGRQGGASLRLELGIYRDIGHLQPGSKEALFRGFDCLARVLALAMPGDAAAGAAMRRMRDVGKDLSSRHKLISRQRFDLATAGYAITYKERLEIHLTQPFAEAIALYMASVLPTQKVA